MIRKVLSFVKQHHMIKRGDHILAGISGGADSVCLLYILKTLQKEYDCKITVAHVEHGIRGEESKRDAEFVQKLCAEQGVACEVFYGDAVRFAKKRGMSLEEGAREMRYAYFEKLSSELAVDRIAIAHNRNDNAETLLFHLARGSGLKGMGGIRPVRGKIIRPLLCVEREEIEAFLQEQHQEYCTDATNQEEIYSRNKIRHQVLPKLKELNSEAVAHLYRSTEYVREACDLVDELGSIAKEECVEGELLKESLLEKPHLIQKTVILDLLGEQAGKKKDLSDVHVEQVLELFSKQTGRSVHLPYGLEAHRTYEGVKVYKRKEVLHNEICIPLNPGEEITLEEDTIKICSCIREKTADIQKIPKKRYTKWFDYDKIKNTVLLRKRCPGDYLVIDSSGNRQKIKKYFVNEKIPAEEREQLLVLAEGEHVLWVIGYRISEEYKVTEATERILEVRVSGGNIHE